MKIQNCLVGVMLVLSLHLKAQQIDYRFQNLSPEKGLSHPDATCMYQDSVGFIWIGTYSGLNRYDGNRIDHFFQNAQQGDRVYINRLNYLASDSAGIIWLGTQGGLSCFDPVLEKYIPIQILRDPEEHKGVVRILIQGKDIWVITEDLRPKRYRQMGKGIIEKIPTRLPLENANFYSFAVGPKGGIWFSTERGIIQWSSSASNMFTLTNEWGREVSPNQILFDSNGSLVAGIPRGFIRIKQEDLATPVLKGNQIDLFPDSLLQSHKVTPNILVSITDILEYEDGTLWFSSFYGCIRYHEGESPNLRY
ncbi:MAG: two-component regulator propeller domain-containing protein, partial [Bacteroidota bacterium]